MFLSLPVQVCLFVLSNQKSPNSLKYKNIIIKYICFHATYFKSIHFKNIIYINIVSDLSNDLWYIENIYPSTNTF